MSKCRSCGARIEWMTTSRGKKMPVDEELVDANDCEVGDLLVLEDGTTFRVGKEQMLGEVSGYVSHFSTCPEGDDWRKK